MDNDAYRDLGRVEGKIDAVLATAERIENRQADHDSRLQVLERNQWRHGAAGAGLSAIVTFTISYLTDIRAVIVKVLS